MPTPKTPISRDPTTELVVANLRQVLAHHPNLERALNNLGGKRALYDILNGRTKSLKVDTLAAVAEALDVPVSLLFVPPGKRDAFFELLRNLDRLPPQEIRRLALIAQALDHSRFPLHQSCSEQPLCARVSSQTNSRSPSQTCCAFSRARRRRRPEPRPRRSRELPGILCGHSHQPSCVNVLDKWVFPPDKGTT